MAFPHNLSKCHDNIQDAKVSFQKNREDAGEGACIYADEHEQSDLGVEQAGKYSEAEEMHRKELALCETVLGKEHPSERSRQE